MSGVSSASEDESDFINAPDLSRPNDLDQRLRKGDLGKQENISLVNIEDVEFLKELRVFCHYYQIPYLEDNAPKTAKNAAKIYLRMVQDGLSLHLTFQGTKLETFLKSVRADELSDEFDPFNAKDRWLHFFRGNATRPELDTDRVLKNAFSYSQLEYISDHLLTFNDN